jgi:hypothetical protein
MLPRDSTFDYKYYVNFLLFCFDDFVDSLYFLPAFWRHRAFSFIILQTLSQKHRGGGGMSAAKTPAASTLGAAWNAGIGHKPLDFDGYIWREH